MAAKGARQHRHVAQVPAFVIAAEEALLHMRGYQEPHRILVAARHAA